MGYFLMGSMAHHFFRSTVRIRHGFEVAAWSSPIQQSDAMAMECHHPGISQPWATHDRYGNHHRIPGLVNVYILPWKDPPFFMGFYPLFRLGHFQLLFVCSPEGNHVLQNGNHQPKLPSMGQNCPGKPQIFFVILSLSYSLNHPIIQGYSILTHSHAGNYI